MSVAPYCQPPDSVLRRPLFKLPSGSIDCHAHICGPENLFPYSSNRIYTPHNALLTDYESLLSCLGVDRAVLVQPSIYGEDNSALIQAIQTNPEKFRGVAVVNEAISEIEIERLHSIGIRGVRCNIVDLADAKGVLPLTNLKKLAEKIAPWGWHIELLMHVNEFSDIATSFHNFPVQIVLGHLGYQSCQLGIHTKGFQGLLALMREGRAWVKFTAPYRISTFSQMPYDDVHLFAQTILENNPHQIVWGTDWPHVMVKHAMPNDADLCDLFFNWVADESLRELILIKNPERLYGFP
jgi:predicted TIM-barrel fold metal-dependent hydrolase